MKKTKWKRTQASRQENIHVLTVVFVCCYVYVFVLRLSRFVSVLCSLAAIYSFLCYNFGQCRGFIVYWCVLSWVAFGLDCPCFGIYYTHMNKKREKRNDRAKETEQQYIIQAAMRAYIHLCWNVFFLIPFVSSAKCLVYLWDNQCFTQKNTHSFNVYISSWWSSSSSSWPSFFVFVSRLRHRCLRFFFNILVSRSLYVWFESVAQVQSTLLQITMYG